MRKTVAVQADQPRGGGRTGGGDHVRLGRHVSPTRASGPVRDGSTAGVDDHRRRRRGPHPAEDSVASAVGLGLSSQDS